MQFPLNYNYRDILTAPAGALAAKRILVMTLFLCGALALYDIFTYLAILVEGESIRIFGSVYGFFPFDTFYFTHAVSSVLYWAGMVVSVLAVMMGMFAVAAFEIESIRGHRFLRMRDAIKFTRSRFKQIFLSLLSIVSFLLLILLLVFIYGLIGRIPFIGEWIYSIFFVIPGFIVGIFTVFIFAVLLVSVILLPAVAAADRNGETFDSILETFSTIIRQPIRWVLFTAYSGVAAKVCGFVYAYFVYRAVQFLVWGSSFAGGDKISELVKTGASQLPLRSGFVHYTFNLFAGVNWGVDIGGWAWGYGAYGPASYLMAFMLFLIFASIYGYMLCVIATAQARAFVIIRCLKDNYKISDEKPLFLKEEHINPKIDEPADKENS